MLAGFVGLFAVSWDDSWHTDRGRDDFFVAPHLLLYSAVLALGIFVAVAVRTGRHNSSGHTIARLGVASLGGVVVSAPVDNAWHSAFGRDAVIWSPPHLLGVAATFALAVTIAAIIAHAPGMRSAAGRDAAGALVIGAAMVAVLEYESDVPQFSVALYLPVVTAIVLFVRPLLRDLDPGKWTFTRAAAWYTGARLTVAVVLGAAGFSTPVVPPLVLVALAADLVGDRAARRRRVVPATVAVAVHGFYVPWLWLVPNGVRFTLGEVGVSLLLSAAVALAATVAGGGAPRRTPRRAVSTARVAMATLVAVGAIGALGAVGVLTAVAARPAAAHDPGQGTDVAPVSIDVRVRDERATLTIDASGRGCAGLVPREIVARRAGVARRVPLRATGPCRATGSVGLDRPGRWFLYAEYRRATTALEVWTTAASPTDTRRVRRTLYAPPAKPANGIEPIGGAAVLALGAALVVMARRAATTVTMPAPDPSQ